MLLLTLALHHMEKGRYFILRPPIFVQAFISSEKAGGPFRIIITFCGRSLSAQVIRLSIFFSSRDSYLQELMLNIFWFKPSVKIIIWRQYLGVKSQNENLKKLMCRLPRTIWDQTKHETSLNSGQNTKSIICNFCLKMNITILLNWSLLSLVLHNKTNRIEALF